ncbi:hypothetical protein SBA1_480013 [Candidatus Sulfotelmatobacter kueseliae]|uniref:Uncharacterized protein n=1 Tax=Candidatus Sulfotelmatobacter kueseliae TaxID=2042962 RepID=A0A2U3KTZ5_9BACT|nr:hypothetical protein SBA1_480013 [Candidatus Sulfotelmatobacter kueseliae]
MGADLRQNAFGLILGRSSEEDGAEAKAATDGFLNDAHTFDGAAAIFREFGMGERIAECFQGRIVPAVDLSKAALGWRFGF